MMNNAWEELDSTKLTNLYTHWLMVLDLILKDEDGDRLTKAKRGK